jgi:hypothetical protein
MAMLLTQPKCDDKTVDNFQGACQFGVGIFILELDFDFYSKTKEDVGKE